MKGEERRLQILNILRTCGQPVSGSVLASKLNVSRQAIVQDIALLRANQNNIISTNRGYILGDVDDTTVSRVFKLIHDDSQVEDELNLIVDCGGTVEDVFVYHKVYGIIRANIHIRSRIDVKNYMKELANGKSSLLKNITSGYHYHTIVCDNEENLDAIWQELVKKGFLAKLQDYEPVDFWNN